MLRRLKFLTMILAGLLLFCTTVQALSFYKASETKEADQWFAEGFGNKVWWLRDHKEPYAITYIKIQTKDGRTHRLARVSEKY